jgi:hypothetical protein
MPAFPRIEIDDGDGDWRYEHRPPLKADTSYSDNSSGKQVIFGREPTSRMDCQIYDTLKNEWHYPPDIASVSFLSNSKTLNSTIWLTNSNDTTSGYGNEDGNQFNNDSISQAWYRIDVFDIGNKNLQQIVNEQLKFLETHDSGFYLYKNESDIGNYVYNVPYVPDKKLVFLHNGKSPNMRYTGDQCKNCKVMELLTTEGNRLYVIYYIAGLDDFDRFLEEVKDMNRSIAFLNDEPASNTSTYDNPNYRIKFDYPSDWFTKSGQLNGSRVSYVIRVTHPQNSISRVLVDNTIYNVTDLNLRNYLGVREQSIKTDPSARILSSSTQAKLGDRNAYNITYTNLQDGISYKRTEVGAIVGDDKVYKVEYLSTLKNYEKDLQEFQHLIDSFQFNVSASMYKNENLGLRMIYPYNWTGAQEVSPYIGLNESYMGGVGFYSPIHGPYLLNEGYFMNIAYDSIYGRQQPYEISVTKNSSGTNWIRNITEIPLQGLNGVTKYNDKNYSNSNLENGIVRINVDPTTLGLPDDFLVYYGKFIEYLKNGLDCYLFDYTDFTSIPPPEFTLKMEPNSITNLRQGDERNIQVILNSKTNLPFNVVLSSENSSAIQTTLTHGTIAGIPQGNTTSNLEIKVLPNAEPKTYTIPITAHIVLEPTINLENSTSAKVTKKSTLSMTVFPPKSPREQLDDIVSWLSPINAIWVFLAAIVAVMSPLILRFYKRKQDKKEYDQGIDY